MRRRQYKPKGERAATAAARQVWQYLFPGEPFTLRVYFYGPLRRTLGDYYPAQRVVRLALRRDPTPLHTLCHEFTHARCPKLRHGAEFDRIVAGLYLRLTGVLG